MQALIKALSLDYGLKFKSGKLFSWSPRTGVIIYPPVIAGGNLPVWSLLHEAGHAILKHQTYGSDLELLMLEAAAWHKAKRLGSRYKLKINEDHIQDCLDTYRDWLHKRSACPTCTARGLQSSADTYECFNCGQNWQVTPARFCRPYRKTAINKKQLA